MRTNITSFTNRNVFGLGQGRAVSLLTDSCARAAQHLESRHAKHAVARVRAMKRRATATMAGAVLKAKWMYLVITGPQWQPVRQGSPDLA
jgi:hypothetical protein